MSAAPGWPLWRRDDPAGLLAYIAEAGIVELLPGLPPRAAGRPVDRLERLRAVYREFAAAGITYADEPITSTGAAQQIRPPDQVLAFPGHGNCLDLSLAFAAACLHAGLHPLLAVCRPAGIGGAAHALVVAWLGGDWPGPGGDRRYIPPGSGGHSPVLTTPPRWPGGLRGAADDDVPGEFVAVDVTLAATSPGRSPAGFSDAAATAVAVLTHLTPPPSGEREQPIPAGRLLTPPFVPAWEWEFGVDVGLGYLPETVVPLPGRPVVPPLVEPYLPAAGAGVGPLAQFRARTEAVPFADRGELGQLLDWCMAPDPSLTLPASSRPAGAGGGPDKAEGAPPRVRIAVVSGAGGSGKTRLAAEAAKRLAGRNWHTGFLSRTVPDRADIEWLARLVSPVLIAVDYVEAADLPALARMIRTLSARRSRTVLVFTARARSDWWQRLTRDLADAGVTSSPPLDLDLSPRPPESARLFSKAYRRFTAQAGTATRDEPQPPGGQERWTALDLVMLAWLAAHVGPGLPGTPEQLYEDVITRELWTWSDAMKSGNRPEPTLEALRIAAACVSLLSPAAPRLTSLLSQAGISNLTSAVPGEITEKLAALLSQPGEAELTLRPDPIADYLILTTFLASDGPLFNTCVDFIDLPEAAVPADGTPPGASASQAESDRFCDNLTRAGENITIPSAVTLACDLATTALARKPGLWRAAFETSLNRGGAFTPALEHLADHPGTPLPFDELAARIPLGHSALRPLALTAAQHSLPAATDAQADPDRAARRAAALDNLGNRLAEVGRREEALPPAEEAAGLYRQLVEAAPAAYLPNLAGSLNNLAARLAEVGRREEALPPAEEAAGLFRQLAEAAPAAYLPNLAGSLNNLAVRLGEVGRREEVLPLAQEAVAIRRRLAEAAPAAYLPDLAGSLNNLAAQLAEAGRREEALPPAEEAAGLYRQLAEATPAAYLTNLALALNNLGNRLAEAGRREEALPPAEEAAGLYRRLAEAAPAAYLPDLAMSLNNLAARLAGAGRREEALPLAEEAAGLFRQLAEAAPAAYLPNLAGSLNNLAARLAEVGRREEALPLAQEAVAIRRRLAEAAPAAYLPNLAGSLNNLGNQLAEAGRREEALPLAQEAVAIRRRLAEAAPAAYLPNLALALNNLGNRLAEAGRMEEALPPAEEAAGLFRQLAEAAPAAYLPDLAMALNNLAAQLAEAGRREEALPPAEEAAGLYRQLAEAAPAAYLPDLALALNNLAARLAEAGRQEEALPPAEEAAGLYRRLAEAAPAAYLPNLAGSLNNLGNQLAEAGRREEALPPAEEAAGLFRQLAEAAPAAYLPDLAMALNNLAAQLAEAGRREEALPPAEEAAGLYRRLAEAAPAAYLPDLAMALNNLGNQLAEAGRQEEALPPAEEAAGLFRQLAEAAPAAYLPNLAGSLNNLAARLAEAGRREEALPPAEEAAGLYRQLAEAAPAAYLPNLAGSLNNLAARLAEAGRREEALPPAEEAAGLYRLLAEAAPAAYLHDLAGSLNNLAAQLAEAGRMEEALTIFADTAQGMSPGPQAEIQLALARWLASRPVSTDTREGQIATIAVAVRAASAETDPARGARARRAVRSVVAGLNPGELTAHLPEGAAVPEWAEAEVPRDVLALFNELLATPTWEGRGAVLHAPRASVVSGQAARSARSALAGLYADNPLLLRLLGLLDAADVRGLDQVLDEVCAAERHADLLRGWLDTPTWTASRQYLGTHPELLRDERTAAVLAAGGGDPVLRRHLAITRLAPVLGLDEAYDIVLDTSDAATAAMAGIDAEDLVRVAEIWHAAPHLARTPFTGAYIAALLIAGSDDGDPDDARQFIREAINQAGDNGQATRLAGASRLRDLARLRPARAAQLTELADLLADGC